MNRRQIYLTEHEIRETKKYSSDLGISISEYIRRIIDSHLESRKSDAPVDPLFLKKKEATKK